MFVGIHAMLASLTDVEEIAITEDEGKAFMSAAANCMRHYGVQASQKAVDHIALVGCVVSIYGPRAFLIRQRLKQKNNPPPEHRNFTVYPSEVINPSVAE